MKVEARAPTRVDLAGGTVDIWPLYLFHPGAQTVNLALRRYATCEITTRADRRVVLVSHDQQEHETYESLTDLALGSVANVGDVLCTAHHAPAPGDQSGARTTRPGGRRCAPAAAGRSG